MFSTVSLLVLACAIAVNAQVPENQQCAPAQIGVVPTGHPVKLPPVVLQPFIADWVVTIPPIPECGYAFVGAQAFACDRDVAPTVFFTDLNHLRIHRNGNLSLPGSVVVTVYC